MSLIIKKTNGYYWNAENDCFTCSLEHATRYEELPQEIDGLELYGAQLGVE